MHICYCSIREKSMEYIVVFKTKDDSLKCEPVNYDGSVTWWQKSKNRWATQKAVEQIDALGHEYKFVGVYKKV